MNNKIYIPIITALIGLLAGYFLFGSQHTAIEEHQHSSDHELAEENAVYICSMHPQIRQNEPGLCPICEMDLVPLEAETSNDPKVLQMTREAVKLASIQTSLVGEATAGIETGLSLAGKVMGDERLLATQTAHVPGRIEQLYITFVGEQVSKGQKLAEIYSPELITAQRELKEAASLKTMAPELLEAARNKLRYWKIDEKSIADIEAGASIRETFTLYSDQSGVVISKKLDVGDYVSKGAPILDVIDLNYVWVVFDAYEEDLSQIKKGDLIQFTSPALPGTTFQAPITFIDPIVDPATRTIALRTEMKNDHGALKPAMLVYGQLQKEIRDVGESLWVPRTAVLWTGKRSVVYVKVPGTSVPTFEYRTVELGKHIENAYEIISGLEKGEEVVTNGSFTIDATAQLNNQMSMMNQLIQVKSEKQSDIPNYQSLAPKLFKTQLTKVLDEYIRLKDGLVATDAAVAKASAQMILKGLDQVDMMKLKGPAHDYWMDQLSSMTAHTKLIVDAASVEEQRKQFKFLSEALKKALEAFGHEGTPVYLQHCPMAFDDEGANWLSTATEILNPYFGDKMLRCGIVKDTILNQ